MTTGRNDQDSFYVLSFKLSVLRKEKEAWLTKIHSIFAIDRSR